MGVADRALNASLGAGGGTSSKKGAKAKAGADGFEFTDEELIAFMTFVVGLPCQFGGMYYSTKCRTPEQLEAVQSIWKQSEWEAKLGGKAAAVVVKKYAGAATEYLPEIVLGAVLVLGGGLRWKATRDMLAHAAPAPATTPESEKPGGKSGD